tara:strand:+ start:879 stop:1079 length:201 start_codon:yes stop_codon:yes gene_type:complete
MRRAEDIAEDIVEFTKSTDNQEELKEGWRVINNAVRYLSSKDDYFTNERVVRTDIEEMKDDKRSND